MKKNSLIFSSLLFLAACTGSDDQTNGEVVSAIEAGGENDAAFNKETESLAEASAREEKEMMENTTTFSLDKQEHDFGTIETGSENSCVFKITNTGTKPLMIYKVGASCGCTTPKKPEHPIAPGKSDLLEVGFKPNGPGPSEKTVTIQANTEPRITTVKIKANVK